MSFAFLAGAWYALWLPALRIQAVDANGPGAAIAKQIVSAQLQGTYAHVMPRNSTVFYPQERIRDEILKAVPEASAVSLKRTSFSSLAVTLTPRAEAFVWCGTNIDAPLPDGSCYSADSDGFVFKRAEGAEVAPAGAGTDASSTSPVMPASSTPPSTASTALARRAGAAPLSQVRVFAPLDRSIADGSSPIGAHVVSPGRIPDALKFVDAIRELGAPVSSLALRDDEADLWLNGPTRITYVLGHEREAAELAASALPGLTLTDGSIQYIDLRFPGKAYVKRYGE